MSAVLGDRRARRYAGAMKTLARAILLCVIAATSLGLGAARGQLRLAGDVVLCAGGAITVLERTPDGTPVARTHVCPDMTTAFLFGFDSPPQVPQRSAWRVERGGVAVGDAVAPQPRPGRKPARGPPAARVA